MSNQGFKTCTKCGVEKPIEGNFNKRKAAKDGYRPTCRACDAIVRAAYDCKELPKAPPSPQTIPLKASEGVPAAPEAASGVLRDPGDNSGTPVLPSGGISEGVSGPPEPPLKSSGQPVGTPKVIGRIGDPPKNTPRIQEVALDPTEEAEKAAAREYANLLNKALPIRTRARLLVKIARNVKGPMAALALKALTDINLATGVVNKQGAKTEEGPLFVLPEGSSLKIKG